MTFPSGPGRALTARALERLAGGLVGTILAGVLVVVVIWMARSCAGPSEEDLRRHRELMDRPAPGHAEYLRRPHWDDDAGPTAPE